MFDKSKYVKFNAEIDFNNLGYQLKKYAKILERPYNRSPNHSD